MVVDLTRCPFVDAAGVAEPVAAHRAGRARDALPGVVVPAAERYDRAANLLGLAAR